MDYSPPTLNTMAVIKKNKHAQQLSNSASSDNELTTNPVLTVTTLLLLATAKETAPARREKWTSRKNSYMFAWLCLCGPHKWHTLQMKHSCTYTFINLYTYVTQALSLIYRKRILQIPHICFKCDQLCSVITLTWHFCPRNN